MVSIEKWQIGESLAFLMVHNKYNILFKINWNMIVNSRFENEEKESRRRCDGVEIAIIVGDERKIGWNWKI